jgi:uncharacterized protein (DUF2235 family)
MTTNIVLLSDGTGNSASSPFKTNVWRVYQALDIETPPANSGEPRQIVYYDNGVGTENFKPLAALGGAFGIGVWQNVKDLYTFTCRNYSVGDQIYGFGFSRGAFTIRLLMGLIGKCGIVKATSEAHLIQCVEMAYEAYRRDFLIRASERRSMIYHHILRKPRYFTEGGQPLPAIDLGMTDCEQVFPDIRFLGVWDTVDAYGMPVDELKFAIDDWVWPMSFADRDPSVRLLTIRHALSLDDERPTFRPVLWNEVYQRDDNKPDDQTKWKSLDPMRIQQVWFPGVHANVGGGYPDDGLAIVSLDWMVTEAEAHGLRCIRWIRDEIRARGNPQGEQYDSRSGIAGYYRYGPRKVSELCADKKHHVDVPTVRVHPAAYARIVARERDYSPVSLSGPFTVAGATQPAPDATGLEEAWDMVWWRRFIYFSTLELTAVLALFFLRPAWPKSWWQLPDFVLGWTESILRVPWRAFSAAIGETATGWIVSGWTALVGHAGDFVPDWASRAVPSFAQYPLSGIASLLLLAWLFFSLSTKFQKRIAVYAESAWASQKKLVRAARPKANWQHSAARKLRGVTAPLYQLWLKVLVPVLGISIGLVALVLLSPYWILRTLRRRRPWMA